MNPKSFILEKVSALRPTKPLLVCETNGFSLRAAVLARSGGEIRVLYAAQSRQGDMTKALAEIVAALEKQGWRPGGRAVLLTPDVVTALLELPADPKKPKPLTQMEELVRWEMEPLMLQQGAVWSVGSILVGLGYLTEAQALDVIKEQQLRSRRPQPREDRLDMNANVLEMKSPFKRFGDLALDLGYISQVQLDDCLSRQNSLKGDDDAYMFGWTPQAAAHAPDEMPDTFSWLASGVGARVMRQWADAFAAHAVKLAALYPLAGCAAACLDHAEDEAILLEANAGMVAGAKFSQGVMSALNHRHAVMTGLLEACLEAWELLQPREGDDFWLAAGDADSDKLAESLEAVLDRKIRLLPDIALELPGGKFTVAPGMLGAARHAWNMAGEAFCCDVPADGPRPPFWQRREVRLSAAAAAGVLLIVAAEIAVQVGLYRAESALKPVRERHEVIQKAVEQANLQIAAAKKAEEETSAKRSEYDTIVAQRALVKTSMPARNALVRGFLEDMDKNTPEDVVLESIQEKPGQGFLVSAWALSDSAAQRYARGLGEKVRRWNQRVVDVQVVNQSGRLGMEGYVLRFRLFAVPEEAIAPGTGGGA